MLWNWTLLGYDIAVVAPSEDFADLGTHDPAHIFLPKNIGQFIELINLPKVQVMRGNWRAASMLGTRGTALGPKLSNLVAAPPPRPLIENATLGIEVENLAICLTEFKMSFDAHGRRRQMPLTGDKIELDRLLVTYSGIFSR